MTSLETEQNGGRKNHVLVKLVLLLIIILGLTWVLQTSGLLKLFLHQKHLQDLLESLGPWSFGAFVALQALQVVAAPIPGDVTGLLGGYLYGPFLGVLLSTIGLTLGSWMAFGLARAFGRPFVERFVSQDVMRRFDYLLHARGAYLVFLLFLIPGFPKDYLCYILGLGHISTLEFLFIGGTGRLFGTILLTLGGCFIRSHKYVSLFVLLGAAVIVVIIAMAYKDKLEALLRELHLRHHRNVRDPSSEPRDECPHPGSLGSTVKSER